MYDAFKKLSHRQRWEMVNKLKGVRWHCEHCLSLVDGGRKPRRVAFLRSELRCGHCDGILTVRTGGGQNDPCHWVPIPVQHSK